MLLLSFCVSWMDQNSIYSFFYLCHSPLCLLNWIGGVQIYLIWVCNGHISSFMINPNGLYPHVPSHATEFELALALIFKTGSTLLVHHWQPGGLELDNHCSYDRDCQYKSPFVCCSVCLPCWLAARRGTEHADMLEQYYGKLHNHCLQAYSKITEHN